MKCHEVDYEIVGHDLQMVEVELDPGETVVAEAGAMTFMEEDIDYDARMGDGSAPDQGFMSSLFSAGKRMISGESLFMTHFTNRGRGKRRVGFSSPFPGKIVALDLARIGGQLYCQKDSFLAAALGTRIDIAFNRKLGVGFFGGEGFILEHLQGDGMVFVHAGGTVIEKRLNNETLRLDTGCLAAFTAGIDYDIEMTRGLKSMFFGGEGLFLATLRGTGTVWIQSLPFSRLADRVIENAPSHGGRSQGEGSVLGGLGRLLDGD
ncbi:MAG TPA: TIGR00266 family protein [Gammaproteobacteria bacterium]|nr:TIGR00266 family protein [Gammaproteobacteria bacterium]